MDNEYAARVLVVDDEVEVRRSLQMCLENEGYQVHLARDGQEAISAVNEINPELILMDVMMPGMDGLAAIRHLKAEPATSHIPIIVLSARTEMGDMVDGWHAGTDVYLEKPFLPQHVVDLVGCVLEK